MPPAPASVARSTAEPPLEPPHEDRSHQVRGHPQRLPRGHRGDGGGAAPQRVLHQHQDPLRFLVLLLRSGSAPHRAVLQPAQPPRFHGGNGAPGGPGLRGRQPRPGGPSGGELSLPRRGPPERHRGDRDLPPPGRDPRLLRQPGPPRGRGRRRSGKRGRLPGDLPGRGDHPPGEDGAGGEDRGRRLPAGDRPDPLQTRDRGRLPGAVRGQQHRGAAPGGAVRTLRPGDGALLHGRAHRLHRPAHPERDPALVLRDVRDGKVSPERAREVYRVAVDTGTWTVDEAGTAHCRQRRPEPAAGLPPKDGGSPAR